MKSLYTLRLVTWTGLALLALAGVPAAGQAVSLNEPSEALMEDAAAYAELHEVGLDEAVRRLQLQNRIGDLDARLTLEERDTYAGLWIQHEPDYRVVVRFTDSAAPDRLRQQLHGSSLASRVEVRPALFSLAQLEEHQAATRHLARQLAAEVDTDINVFENRVELYSVDTPGLGIRLSDARLELPASVAMVPVERLAEVHVLRGGDSGSTCTGGFTVRKSNGDQGISTAAHCGNTQSFNGNTLNFRAEDQAGNQDVQWHSACEIEDVSNQFDSGIGLRSCSGTRSRTNQAIGAFVCKFGMTTGRTCGDIESKSYAPSYVTSASSTFIRVDGGSTNLSSGGDSGGPWFVETIAYGIHSGEPGSDGNDALYMPINYISSIGVSVLTFDPSGPGCTLCTPSGQLCTSGSECCSFSCVPLGLGGLKACN